MAAVQTQPSADREASARQVWAPRSECRGPGLLCPTPTAPMAQTVHGCSFEHGKSASDRLVSSCCEPPGRKRGRQQWGGERLLGRPWKILSKELQVFRRELAEPCGPLGAMRWFSWTGYTSAFSPIPELCCFPGQSHSDRGLWLVWHKQHKTWQIRSEARVWPLGITASPRSTRPGHANPALQPSCGADTGEGPCGPCQLTLHPPQPLGH